MGIVKDSLPPVPEDKEVRAKNRARNEEQKKIKEDKKAKAVRKVQRREISAKNHREAEKAGVPPPDYPETLVSEIEGGGDNAHWLDELAEEDDAIPPVGGGIEIPEGSRARGGVGGPRGVPGTRGRADHPTHYCRRRGRRHSGGLCPRGSPREGEGVGGRVRGAPTADSTGGPN